VKKRVVRRRAKKPGQGVANLNKTVAKSGAADLECFVNEWYGAHHECVVLVVKLDVVHSVLWRETSGFFPVSVFFSFEDVDGFLEDVGNKVGLPVVCCRDSVVSETQGNSRDFRTGPGIVLFDTAEDRGGAREESAVLEETFSENGQMFQSWKRLSSTKQADGLGGRYACEEKRLRKMDGLYL
jgi:hypothetical protein